MLRALSAVAAVALLMAPSAGAQAPAETVQELLREQSCRTLAGGTVNLPDPVSPATAAELPAAWAPVPDGRLPATVPLRDEAVTFNRLYEFATQGGNLYARVRRDAPGGQWRQVPLPPCLAGRVESISADDDELVALDLARRIFTLDNALKAPALWNWSSRWGTPLWNGPGYALPGVLAWSWTVISAAEDATWTDPAGNHTAVGTFKVSHIWGLRDGGQRLTFWDPWLPLDDSYEMCGPHRGRFRAVNLSTSGSHVAVVGAHGDLFTRLYDFDISGHDPVFFSYSYASQRGKGDRAPIQLPAEPWAQQPKIPGAITSAISIGKTGTGAVHASLRVEGVRAGSTGYWERDIADPPAAGWSFRPTGLPLRRPLLDNPPGDSSRLDLGPSEERRYRMSGGAVSGELRDFSVYCSPARLRLREADGSARELVLHHIDGLRQQVRRRGLDDVPRTQSGAIEGPKGHFEVVTVRATRAEILVEEKGWRFRLGGPAPLPAQRCLPQAAAVGARGIGPVLLGTARTALLEALPAPSRRGVRAWRWCVDGGGTLTAVFAADGRVALVRSTAPGHRLRGVGPGSRVAAARRALPRARSLGAGVLLAAPGSPRVLVVRGARVRAVAVAPRAVTRVPARLRALLRAAG